MMPRFPILCFDGIHKLRIPNCGLPYWANPTSCLRCVFLRQLGFLTSRLPPGVFSNTNSDFNLKPRIRNTFNPICELRSMSDIPYSVLLHYSLLSRIVRVGQNYWTNGLLLVTLDYIFPAHKLNFLNHVSFIWEPLTSKPKENFQI